MRPVVMIDPVNSGSADRFSFKWPLISAPNWILANTLGEIVSQWYVRSLYSPTIPDRSICIDTIVYMYVYSYTDSARHTHIYECRSFLGSLMRKATTCTSMCMCMMSCARWAKRFIGGMTTNC